MSEIAQSVLVATKGFRRSKEAEAVLMRKSIQLIDVDSPGTDFGDSLNQLSAGQSATVVAAVLGDQKFSAGEMDRFPNLKTIARMGTGYDNIDVREAGKRGILVSRTSGVNAKAVSDLVLGLIIALNRNIVRSHRSLAQNDRWERPPGRLLSELTVGVVGLGAIGKLVVEKLGKVGVARLLGYNRTLRMQMMGAYELDIAPLDYLLHVSDVAVCCLPLTPETRHLISRERMLFMKPGAMIINVGRGAVVDESALIDCLESGHLGGAALDVYSKEPPMGEEIFTRLQALARRDDRNIILTPHMGSIAHSTESEAALRVAANILGVLENRMDDVELIPEFK